jgi:septum formation protein
MLILASASPRRRELLTQAGFTFEIHPAHIPEDPLPNEDPIAYVTRLARQKAEAVFRELTKPPLDSEKPASPEASGAVGQGFSPDIEPAEWKGALAPEGSSSESSTRPGAPGPASGTWDTTNPHRSSGPALYQGTTSVVPRAPGKDVWALAPEEPLIVLGADTAVTLDNHILGKPESPSDAARMLRLLSGRTHQVITGIAVVTANRTEVAAEVTGVRFLTLSNEEIEAYIATGEPMDKAGAYAIQGRAASWIPRIQGDYFNVVGLPIALVSTLIESFAPPTAPANLPTC